MTRVVAWMVGLAALVGSGAYVFVYIYRWEWNRALIMLGFFVATEVALSTALVLRALAREAAPRTGVDREVLDRLRATRPQRDHFAWLEQSSTRFNVFVTLLVGGGVIVSAAAWLVDRLASRVGATPHEHALAGRLSAIAFPADGLVAGEAELLAQEVPFRDDAQIRLLLGPQRPHR